MINMQMAVLLEQDISNERVWTKVQASLYPKISNKANSYMEEWCQQGKVLQRQIKLKGNQRKQSEEGIHRGLKV